MISKMKRYEALAVEHAKRLAKSWDYHCLSTDSYLAGYRQGQEDAKQGITGQEPVELEFKEGTHQLSMNSFNKWKQENENLSLKEALKIYLPWIDFKDLRVSVAKDGTISFQGTASKRS